MVFAPQTPGLTGELYSYGLSALAVLLQRELAELNLDAIEKPVAMTSTTKSAASIFRGARVTYLIQSAAAVCSPTVRSSLMFMSPNVTPAVKQAIALAYTETGVVTRFKTVIGYRVSSDFATAIRGRLLSSP